MTEQPKSKRYPIEKIKTKEKGLEVFVFQTNASCGLVGDKNHCVCVTDGKVETSFIVRESDLCNHPAKHFEDLLESSIAALKKKQKKS